LEGVGILLEPVAAQPVTKLPHAAGLPPTLPRDRDWHVYGGSAKALGTGGPLLGLAVLVELRDVGPEIVDLVLVLDAGEGHLGAGNLCFGVLDVFLELGLVPGDAGVLVGVGVIIIR